MENMFPKMRLYVSYRQGSWDKFFCEDEASQEHTHTLFTHMNCSMPACVCVLTYIHLYTHMYTEICTCQPHVYIYTWMYTHVCTHIILVLICYIYMIYMLTYLIWRFVISQLLIIYHYPLFYTGFSSKNGFFLLPSVILQSPLGLCLWKVIIS